MHVWLDTPVIASDDVTVGYVDKLVVHPASWKTLHILVRILPRWKRSVVSVPAAQVARATPSGTWLTVDNGAFHASAGVGRETYQPAPKDWLPPFNWPRNRVYWPADFHDTAYPLIPASQMKGWGTVRAVWKSDAHVPAGGPVVLSQDGYKVGEQAQVVKDDQTGLPREVRFSGDAAFWQQTSVTLPGGWVASCDRWALKLAFDLEKLEEWVQSRREQRNVHMAGDRLEQECAREQRHESLFDVDPYDVLAQPSESGFKTPFEWDEASMINPQARPPRR